jgi:hypothetical protein
VIAALAATLLPFALPAGCSEDASSTTQGGPTGNPSLSIVRPADSTCIPIGPEAEAGEARIPIEVTVQEVLLRPPGVCGTIKQCGQLVLRVNGVENNTSSGTVIDVVMRKLADRYADLTISVSVRNDEGETILDHSDAPQPLAASISITTKESCGTGGSGGMGGATSTATAGGMSSTGGSGGMGGSGGTGGSGGVGGAGGSAGTGGAGGAGGAGGSTASSGMGGMGGAGPSGTGGTGG